MGLSKQQIWILVGVGGLLATALLTSFVIKKRKKKKIVSTEGLVVKGGYIVPKGTPSMGDALHSFERRKSDGFGGRMSTKIKEQLVALYEKGINPEVTDLKVEVDSKNYEVKWEATIKPSTDGKAYTGFMTYGSAGGCAYSRALGQEKRMKEKVGGKNYKLVLDFKNPTGIYIRQLFFQYEKDEYPAHK